MYKVIKMKELMGVVGISRSYLYALQARGDFPMPIRLVEGGRATGYLRSEIDAWLKGRIDATRGNAGKVAHEGGVMMVTTKDCEQYDLDAEKEILEIELERLKKINAILKMENTSLLNTLVRIENLIGTTKS